MYNIFSLNGGGIRGVVEIVILERLLRYAPTLLDEVDLIAGTSTGGIIALGLAAGVELSVMRDLYCSRGEAIFRPYQQVHLGLLAPKYTNAGLKDLLASIFGERKLGSLKKNVCIPAFDLRKQKGEGWGVKVFHNFPGFDSDADEAIVDVALATSAAPTYFPSHRGYIDGGVAVNNPAMAAVALTQDPRIRWTPPQLGELCVLSLGCGATLQYVDGEDLHWGKAQWATKLLQIIFDGTLMVPQYQCQQILNARAHFVAPFFPSGKGYDLDDHKNVGNLECFARSIDLTKTQQWLTCMEWGIRK